ncbi:T9SS type A sorting domain-containing protein [bacterium]|nr:T9SS type A sorting domain-containing protein [bacterium]
MKKGLLIVLFVLLAAGMAYGDYEFVYEKTQDTGARCRGLAIYAEDDAFVGIATSPYQMQWYHNMDQGAGLFSCNATQWVCPTCVPPETIVYTYNWGAGIEYYGDKYVYHANQDWDGEHGHSVLVWDHACNPIDRLETDINPSGSEYITAVDLDADGNVYVALYIDGATLDQVEIYPPRASWVVHHAAPIQSLETGSYVCEGMCVNAAGTIIWATNRSSTGSYGWAKRFTGSVAAGYTEDVGFVCPVEGYVRGIDVDEANNRVFICCDNNGSPDGLIIIADAITGTHLDTIICDSPPIQGTSHGSPYDIEWDPLGEDLYVQHRYGWYVDKYHWGPGPAVTMSSFEAIGAEEQVELSWRVESEVDNAGYRIYRDSELITFVDGRGNSDSPLTYTWIDKDVTAGVMYRYRIADVDLNGNETMHDFVAEATPKAGGQVPTDYVLYQNYPNPFNADTHIRFTLADAGHTTLKIYNTTGQLVRTLVDEHRDARTHEVRWDGRNQHNELVSSGIYFYRLASGTFAETKKMSFLR